MTDISPIQIAAPKVAKPSAAPASAKGSDAPAAFGALFDDASQAPATGANGLPEDRQGEADDGKTLPDKDEAADPNAPDPRLMWLPFALPPVPVATPVEAAAALPQIAATTAQATDVTAQPDAPDQIAGDTAASDRLVAMFNAAQADKAAKLAPPAPVVAEAAAATTPTLGAAIDSFLQPLREDRKKPVFEPLAASTSLTTESVLRHAVQATGDAKNVPLDLRNDQGLQHMIDRIETLRDDANANDTRIRLVPDALGGVDVAVKRAGDALHVSFTTDTEHARALIAEAQPRLVELAEARGVRIADASVQTGTGNDRSAQQPFQQQPRQASRPASATGLSTPIETTGDDARLA
jgi:flagellar hook-length control protein FliK